MREEHMNMLEALEIIDAAKGYRDWSPIFDPDIPVRERKERREGTPPDCSKDEQLRILEAWHSLHASGAISKLAADPYGKIDKALYRAGLIGFD